MPWLTDLAVACRRSGLSVVEQPGWQSRGHGQMSGVRTITCHHTAGPRTGESPSLGVVRDGRPGLEGPLAQLFLSRSGVVHVVAAGLAYHAGVVFDPNTQGNPWAIGIEAEATGVDPWPAGQYAAYARLCRALCEHYRLPVSAVLGHKEVASPRGRKIDPNFDMAAFRAAVAGQTGVDDMALPDRVPDYYTAANDTLPTGEAIAWGTTHAAHARDRATEARDIAKDAVRAATVAAEGVAAVKADVAALRNLVSSMPTAELGDVTVNVDMDLLAEKVADLLASRLAS